MVQSLQMSTAEGSRRIWPKWRDTRLAMHEFWAYSTRTRSSKLARLAVHTLCCRDVVIASQGYECAKWFFHVDTTVSFDTRSDAETDASATGADAFPRVRVRSAITTLKSDVPKQSTVYLYGMAASAEPKGWTGSKLLYGSCMRLACI
jgi:hypothetical protein